MFNIFVFPKSETPFDSRYLANSCEASSESFFFPSNNQLHSEATSAHLSLHFLNIDGKYKKLYEFMMMQTFHLTGLSKEESDKCAPNLPEIKQVSFDHVNHISQDINDY